MRLLTPVLLVATFSACSGPGSGDAPLERDLARHLREAQNQIRHGLAESAGAELDRCRDLAPESPQLAFQSARLRLLEADESSVDHAETILEGILTSQPASLRTQRLLYELARRRGDLDTSARLEREINAEHGELGVFEMQCLQRLLRGDERIFFRPAELAPTGHPDLDMLTSGLDRLKRVGQFAPDEAVPRIEEVLRRHPDLAGFRLIYARSLIKGVILYQSDGAGEAPRVSSELVLDMAQMHLELAFDQLDPKGRPATEALRWLSRVAENMADHEETVVLTEILLRRPGTSPAERTDLLGRKAFALYKLGRHAECVEVLETSIAGRPGNRRLAQLWLLRLAQIELGIPESSRRPTFAMRRSLISEDPMGLGFTDIAPDLGIDRLDGYGPSAWGDVDRDGDLELFVSGGDSFCSLYRREGERFVDISRDVGLDSVDSGFSSTLVDVDNDGWLDLFIGRNGWSGPGPNSLFRNRGDGTFVDVTREAGLEDPGDAFVHTWSDVDRDGDLDLFVANGITLTGATNRLYRNRGDGTFVEATDEAGLTEPAGTRTIGAAFGDYDRDGWPDLFVSGFETVNRLYRNRGDGTFDEVATAAGVDGIDHISTGYVSFFIDYDNDEWPDILRTSLAPFHPTLLALSEEYELLSPTDRDRLRLHGPRLYRNNRDGTFTEVSGDAGLVLPMGCMGSTVGDVDNDGWIDVYFGTGDPGLARLEPDRFFRNNGDGTFSDLTFVTGLGNMGKGHGITTADLDDDGDLEIYAPEGGMVHGDLWRNALYLNHQTTGNHWLHIDVEGVSSNRDGLDTRISVTAGDLVMIREVKNGEGFGSTNSPTVEFGLGRAGRVDRLRLEWPSGITQVFDDLPVNQRIVIREGDHWRPVVPRPSPE